MSRHTSKSPSHETVKLEETVITNEPIVNKVLDAAVIDQVIDKKFIEVHKQDIVTEIHEQPVVEIHEKPVVQKFIKDSVFSKVTKDALFEEIQAPPLSEEQVINMAVLQTGTVETTFKADITTTQIEEKEFVKKIEIQPIVELHEQPRITRIHEQEIVEIQEQPITRVIHENPIIKRYVNAENQTLTRSENVQFSSTDATPKRRMRRAIYLIEVERPE